MRTEYKYNINDLNKYIKTTDNILLNKCDNKYSLGIGVTTRCNLDCPMCYYHANSRENRVNKDKDISVSLLQKILDNSPIFLNINISLEGEPFCHPKIFQILDLVNPHTETISIATNANLLNKEKILALKKYNFAHFVLSLDSSDATSYSSFRRGGNFKVFIKNASLLVDSLYDKVIINTVLCNNNLVSAQNIPIIAHKIGISSINIMQVRTHKWNINRGISEPNINELKKSLSIFFENAEKYRLKIFLDYHFANIEIMNWIKSIKNENIIVNKPEKCICDIPWYYTSILSNGSLFPCCGDLQPMSIQEYSFDGIFNHPYLIILRNCLSKKILTNACADCRYLV